MLRRLKEKILENFEVYQEQFRGWWSKLAFREKVILGSASGLLGLVLLLAGAQQGFELLSSAFGRVDLAERLTQVQSQVNRILQLQSQANRYDQLRGGLSDEFNFETEVNRRASRLGLNIDALRPSSTKSLLAEESSRLYEIRFSKETNLDRSLRFLDDLQSILGVRLINLRMKPGFQDRSQFEVEALFAVSEDLQ